MGYKVFAQTEIEDLIMKRDSLLFQEAFNKCKTNILLEIIDDDFEMYHDQSGTVYGRENFIEGIKIGICSLKYKPIRKLISSELQILKSDGNIYGVLQNGLHEFYAIEDNKAPYLTSTAEFSHLWVKQDGGYTLKRVFSYNHRSPDEIKAQKQNSSLAKSFSIDSLLKIHNVPAIGIALIKEGKLQQVALHGELEKGKIAPYNTIYNVASLTKPIVTILTLLLVDKGVWDLDEPLHHYWTDPDVANDSNSKKITTRHVLSHQTGFKNWRSENKSGRLEFDFPPGSAFRYSGEGFEYLKKALESKFNTKLELLCNSLIFEPLKMEDTYFYWSDSVDENRFAKWHDAQGINSYLTYKNKSASAADDLLSTIEDYGRFAEFVLNGANLSAGLFNQMISQQNGTENSIKMGLGWEILSDFKDDEYVLLHTGGDIGVNTLIMLLPKSKEGIVIFTNGDNGKNLFFKLIERNLSLGKQIVGKAK